MDKNKKNSLWLAIQYFIVLLLSMITLKLNLKQYGEEAFGVWILLSSLWGFSKVIDLGYGTALIKFIAQYKDDEEEKIKKIMGSAFVIFLVLGVIIFLVMIFVAQNLYLNDEKLIRAELRDESSIYFLILGVGFYFRYIGVFFRSTFEGKSEFVFTSKINIVQAFLIFFSVLIVYIYKLNLTILSVFYTISALIILINLVYKFVEKYPFRILSITNFDGVTAKEMTSLSIGIQGAAIFGNMIDPVIKYSLGHFYTINSISYYEVAQRFSTGITGLFNTSFRTLLPRTSSFKSKEQIDVFLENETVNIAKFGITFAGLVYGVMGVAVTFFIKFWFHYDEAILFFVILSLSESVNKFGFPIYSFLMGTGKVYFLASIQLINLIIIVISMYVGFLLFKNYLGLLGYFITIFIVNIMMLIKLEKETRYPILRFLGKSESRKLGLLLIAELISVFVLNYFQVDFWIPMAGLSLFSILIFYSNIRLYGAKLFSLLTAGLR